MSSESMHALELFYCYAHEDRVFREELDQHLAVLKRSGMIESWYDGEIVPGSAWEQSIADHLNRAHLVLLLISSHFLTSDHCYSQEMTQALARHQEGEAKVIPILLRPVDWQGSPFSTLQMLPSGAKPITSWPNRDEALEDVAKGIRRAVEAIAAQLGTPLVALTKEQNRTKGSSLQQQQDISLATMSESKLLQASPSIAGSPSRSQSQFSVGSSFTSFLLSIRNVLPILLYGIVTGVISSLLISIIFLLSTIPSIGVPFTFLAPSAVIVLSGFFVGKEVGTYRAGFFSGSIAGIVFGVVAAATSNEPLSMDLLAVLICVGIGGFCSLFGTWLALRKRS